MKLNKLDPPVKGLTHFICITPCPNDLKVGEGKPWEQVIMVGSTQCQECKFNKKTTIGHVHCILNT
jgi:hypothetical protein